MSGPPTPINPANSPVVPAGKPWWLRWRGILAGVAALTLLVLGAMWWYARIASGSIRSIAILPFADESPQKDPDWFCDGITEETIDAMARIPGIQVVARTSAFAFRSQPRDLRKIGEQLGVAAALEGSTRRSGGILRITVQLTRTRDGYHLWSHVFDRPAQDEFQLPQDIAAALAQRVRIGATPAPTRHQPASPEALNEFLQGRHFFGQGDAASIDKAAEHFDAATGADPEFARAWAWLAIAREYRVDLGTVRANEGMPGSRDAAERAVALDPGLGETHLALGLVKLQYDWDWTGAKEELDRAVLLDPGSSLVRHWMAHWLETQGRIDEAIAEMQRTLALDPLSDTILSDVVGEYIASGLAAQALPLARKAVDLYPDSASARLDLIGALQLTGQKDKARQMLDELRNSPAATQLPAFQFDMASAEMGDRVEAQRFLDKADDLREQEGLSADVLAFMAAAAGDRDDVFHWLDLAYDERSVHLPYVRLDPDIPQSDPRFAAFLQRMNLPVQWDGPSPFVVRPAPGKEDGRRKAIVRPTR